MGSNAPKMAAPAFWSASKKQKVLLLQVTEHRLFHVTRAVSYNPHSPFTVGQTGESRGWKPKIP
jgi:hypothetical protein